MDSLSPRLKSLVDESGALLGEVIRAEKGEAFFRLVESTRKAMAGLRSLGDGKKAAVLRREREKLKRLPARDRLDFARSYTLLLELMNACENAYRSFSIREKALPLPDGRPEAVIYVLTAHPTEARDPANIWVFHELQRRLTRHLLREEGPMSESTARDVLHLLHLAWRSPVVRARKPRVEDEAEHIFTTALRDETLRPLLRAGRDLAPLYLRSWVGGDKDGHPGVNETTFRNSLTLSRKLLLRFALARLREVHEALAASRASHGLAARGAALRRCLTSLKMVRAGDGTRAKALRLALRDYSSAYREAVGAEHPSLSELEASLRVFPGFVLPLEFRESSDMLGEPPIRRMLQALRGVARGGDPRWYVRGLVVSMTQEIGHVRKAASLVQSVFGGLPLPIVPLFEQAADLQHAPAIVREMLKDPALERARKACWGGYLELMVGYSDSSKESGVLPSRLEIAEVMHELDRLARRKKVVPLFFQGSGGSVDRGGGSIPEQTAWWPAGALRNYKVTVQGEMVERSFASAEITRRQLERIVASAGGWKARERFHYRPAPVTKRFAGLVAARYRKTVGAPDFLHLVEAATPYPFLDRLRIGSRPSKRKSLASVSDLRAIPWVLCWTQTRLLFPTWWGVGGAWEELRGGDRRALKRAYRSDPAFGVFVRALAYTLAKVELPVWELYVEQSELPLMEKKKVMRSFRKEIAGAKAFLRAVKAPSPADRKRAWLLESIHLRSPMIHPLNLLQLLALEENDSELLRITVTGIANGMVATG